MDVAAIGGKDIEVVRIDVDASGKANAICANPGNRDVAIARADPKVGTGAVGDVNTDVGVGAPIGSFAIHRNASITYGVEPQLATRTEDAVVIVSYGCGAALAAYRNIAATRVDRH